MQLPKRKQDHSHTLCVIPKMKKRRNVVCVLPHGGKYAADRERTPDKTPEPTEEPTKEPTAGTVPQGNGGTYE